MAARKKTARVEAREYWELLSEMGKQRISNILKYAAMREHAGRGPNETKAFWFARKRRTALNYEQEVIDSGMGAGELSPAALKEIIKLGLEMAESERDAYGEWSRAVDRGEYAGKFNYQDWKRYLAENRRMNGR